MGGLKWLTVLMTRTWEVNVRLLTHENDEFVARCDDNGKMFYYKNKTTNYEWTHRLLKENRKKKNKTKGRKK